MQQRDSANTESERVQRPEPGFGPEAEDAAWYARRWLPLVSQYYPPLIDQLWLAPGDRVLDVACGPGALVAQIAPVVGPFGRVVGLDWSTAMLHAGLRLIHRHDAQNATFALGDMRALPLQDGSFDVAVCVLGLGGGAGPRLGLAEMRRIVRPGGRIATITPAVAAQSPGSGLLLELLGRHRATGGHNAGYEGEEPAAVQDGLRAAGFTRTGSTAVSATLKRVDFDDFWADVLAGRLPGSAQYRAQPAPIQAAVRAAVRTEVERFAAGTRLAIPTQVVLAWGTA